MLIYMDYKQPETTEHWEKEEDILQPCPYNSAAVSEIHRPHPGDNKQDEHLCSVGKEAFRLHPLPPAHVLLLHPVSVQCQKPKQSQKPGPKLVSVLSCPSHALPALTQCHKPSRAHSHSCPNLVLYSSQEEQGKSLLQSHLQTKGHSSPLKATGKAVHQGLQNIIWIQYFGSRNPQARRVNGYIAEGEYPFILTSSLSPFPDTGQRRCQSRSLNPLHP